MIAENSSLPKFELSDATGSVVRSSDLKGKKCVIYFYPKDFTPGCTIEADEFSKDYKKFQKAGIEIVGISKDDVESHKKFCGKMNIPYILLADTKTQFQNYLVFGAKRSSWEESIWVLIEARS